MILGMNYRVVLMLTVWSRWYSHDTSGNGTHWVCDAFRYGYVDNVSNSDIDGCSFDISWAVDKNRKPVALDHIDFVRVYSAQNQMCGWLGETSTEVSGAEDLHLQKSISAKSRKRDNK